MEQAIIEFIKELVIDGLFPIAMCLILFWKMTKDEQIHKAETDKLSEVINNNTIILEKILTKLDMDSDSK